MGRRAGRGSGFFRRNTSLHSRLVPEVGFVEGHWGQEEVGEEENHLLETI